jgi:predicted MFS family arabinose efflux permease
VLWLMMLALAGTAAALGAIDVAVPAAARAQGEVAAAGLLLSGMAVGTMAGSLLAGPRQWTWPAEHRVIVLQLVMGAGIAGAALAASHLWALGLVLLIPAAILGVLFTTLYVLVDRLSPEGSRTQTFAWLVTANNGGIGVGAALGGALTQSSGAGAGLWFGAICAFLGVIPAVVAAGRSVHGPNPPQTGGMTGVGSDKRRINQPQGNGESGEGP